MIKVFKKEYIDRNAEVKIINVDTGNLTRYSVSKELGFPFGLIEETNVYNLGYNDINEYIKTMKDRNFLGTEIDYKEQRESERIGYLNLGVERIKRHNRINTRDFEDIIEKLQGYGMGFVDAQNCIIGNYLYYSEQQEQIL